MEAFLRSTPLPFALALVCLSAPAQAFDWTMTPASTIMGAAVFAEMHCKNMHADPANVQDQVKAITRANGENPGDPDVKRGNQLRAMSWVGNMGGMSDADVSKLCSDLWGKYGTGGTEIPGFLHRE